MTNPIPGSAHPGVLEAHTHVSLVHLHDGTLLAGTGYFPDVSEFNGPVDWSALGAAYRAGTISAVAIRAGFGTVRADAQFAANQAGARAQGIPVIYYWFCYPAYNTAAAEAAMFNQTVGPLQPGEAMCGDFEDDPQAKSFPRGQAGLQWCRDFLTALQAPQNATWWYTYPSLLSAVGLQPLIGAWPFWEADYSATPDTAFAPAIARQFTDCGQTPGVGGCCDQSRVLQAPLSQWLTPGLTSSPKGEGDGMGFLSRDVTGETLDEVYAAGGEAQWGIYLGGAGEWIATGTAAPTNLGSPAGAKDLVEATGALTTHTGTERLNVRGVRKDGSRWVKVLSLTDDSVIQDWTQASVGPPQDVPTSTPDDDGALASRIATLEADLAAIKAAIK